MLPLIAEIEIERYTRRGRLRWIAATSDTDLAITLARSNCSHFEKPRQRRYKIGALQQIVLTIGWLQSPAHAVFHSHDEIYVEAVVCPMASFC